MESDRLASWTVPEFSTSTSQPVGLDAQERGKWFWYHRNVFQDYQDSAEVSEFIEVALAIFGEEQVLHTGWRPYGITESQEEPSSFHLTLVPSDIEKLATQLSQFFQEGVIESEDETETELTLHDYREPGIRVNWKKAMALYKRIHGE